MGAGTGITGATVTAMIVRGLIELDAGRSLRGWVGLMAIIGRIHHHGRRTAMVKGNQSRPVPIEVEGLNRVAQVSDIFHRDPGGKVRSGMRWSLGS
jgi:hypothetical protein